MKTLFLLRHAQTEGYDFNTPDHERRLTETGIQDAIKLGQLLYDEKTRIDYIISSSAVRAHTTARLIADRLHYAPSQIILEDNLYQCTEKDIVNYLNNLSDDSISSVLLVNHNPTISSLVRYLTDKDYGFMSPCSLAQIQFEVSNWSDITKGNGRLVSMRNAENRFQA